MCPSKHQTAAGLDSSGGAGVWPELSVRLKKRKLHFINGTCFIPSVNMCYTRERIRAVSYLRESPLQIEGGKVLPPQILSAYCPGERSGDHMPLWSWLSHTDDAASVEHS